MDVLYLTLEAEIGNPGAEKNFHPSRRKFFFLSQPFCCFGMFVSKLFTYLMCAYLKK